MSSMLSGWQTGRSVVITGASSGFGARLAHAFAEAGFGLLLCGRDQQRLDGIRHALGKRAVGRCEVLAADLRTAAASDALRGSLCRHGTDIVVNNAAVNPELVRGESLASLPDVLDVIGTNTSAAIAVCLIAFEHFCARGGGTIVNVNSIAGLRGSGHEPVYAASKFGLRGFAESVKDAWLTQGVRVIDIYPGAIATGMSAGRSDVRDLIDPEELAAFVVRLCETHSFYPREINIQKTPPIARQTRKVVFANGVFDLLHPGHLALLAFARSLGDTLIVGINSDRAVRLLKGPERPIRDEHARKAAVESLRFVDKAVIFDDIRTTDIVRQLMPDVIVKGAEHSVETIRTTDKIPEPIEIVTFPVLRDASGEKLSTTGTIARLRQES